MTVHDDSSNIPPIDRDMLTSLFSDFQHIFSYEHGSGMSKEYPSFPRWYDEISAIGKQVITRYDISNVLHDAIADEYVDIAFEKTLAEKQALRDEVLNTVMNIQTIEIDPLLKDAYMLLLGGYADIAILEAILNSPFELGEEIETSCHNHIAKHHEKYGAIRTVLCQRVFEHLHRFDEEEYNNIEHDIRIMNSSKSSTKLSRENRSYFDWYDELSPLSKEMLTAHDSSHEIRRRLLVHYIDNYLNDALNSDESKENAYQKEIDSLSKAERQELETELTTFIFSSFECDEEIKMFYSKLIHFNAFSIIVDKLDEMNLLVGNCARDVSEGNIQTRKAMLEVMIRKFTGKISADFIESLPESVKSPFKSSSR